MGGIVTVVQPIVVFWLICAFVAVTIWTTGELVVALAFRRRIRFSLSTLLVATTVVAVGLGLIVSAAGK
jgi:hypothetical protein